MSDDVTKYLDKLPLNEIYKDLMQPSFRAVGEFLGVFLELPNNLVLGLKLFNAEKRQRLKKRLVELDNELLEIKAENRIQPPAELAEPILDRLTEVSNDDLANRFIQLLRKASDKDFVETIHPSFVKTLDELSVAEISFLEKFRKADGSNLDYLITYDLEAEITKFNFRKKSTQEEYLTIYTGMFSQRSIICEIPNFEKNDTFYLGNLQRLALIQINEKNNRMRVSSIRNQADGYEFFDDALKFNQEFIEEKLESTESRYGLYLNRKVLLMSTYAQKFLDACMK